MNSGRLVRDEWIILAALALFALFFRLSTVMMINTGVDERDYWLSAKAIARGLPYPELSHRTTRFALILPVALAQFVLGSRPNVYYVMPILNNMLQAALAFSIGLRLRGRVAGFLAALAIVVFPYMIRAGSQVRPEVFSITYILLATRSFIEYLGREREDSAPLLWTSLWLFVAYEAKITNLFFVPGFALAILIYKGRPRHAFILCGSLIALFAIETGLYAIFTEYRFGELEIIMRNHFHTDSFTVPRLVDLLQRYSPEYLQLYWSLPFIVFAVLSALYLARGSDIRVRGIVLGALGFFLFLTIEVKSLNPVTPAEAFINRYFCAVLGPVFLVLAFAAEGAARRLLRDGRLLRLLTSTRFLLIVIVLCAAGTMAAFSIPGLPAGLREYASSPLYPERHPFALNERYRLLANEAYDRGIPIVSASGIAGQNAISCCAAFYLDLSTYRGGHEPQPEMFTRNGVKYYVLGSISNLDSASNFLAALRAPFRVEPIGIEYLRSLADERTIERNE